MPIVRQVPKLYLRGSLANVTMKNLTEDEKIFAAATAEYVASHPKMAKHKAGFMEELRKTIGADYSDDRKTAEEEYHTAIWKATVELFYHRKYAFICENCGSTSYPTQTGRLKEIDSQKDYCPNCKKCYVVDSGDTKLVAGSYVTKEEFQLSYITFGPLQKAPKGRSPIRYIAGDKKYTDAQARKILDDDKQLVKFFGEFVWNYFRQQINENKRKEHRVKEKICDRADKIIVEELLALCGKHKLDFNYCPNSNPNNGYFSISVVGLITPPEFSMDLAVLSQKAMDNKITIDCRPNEIRIMENSMAGNLEATISKPEHVLVLENTTTGDDVEGNSYTISQLAFRTVGAERMDQEDHVQIITNADLMKAVRASLPSGDCQRIFDIHAGIGPDYLDYIEEFGNHSRPRKNHLARFFGITMKSVTQHLGDIKIQCLAHDFTP